MEHITSNELRRAWKEFYIKRGHVDVGAVSLVSDGSTGVLFNDAVSVRQEAPHGNQTL